MIISRLFLFIIIFLFLFIPSSAFEDTMQNHPSDDPEQGDSNNMWTLMNNVPTIISYSETYNKVLRIGYSGSYSGIIESSAYNTYGSESTYWSFMCRDVDWVYYPGTGEYPTIAPVGTNEIKVYLNFYDEEGVLILSHQIEDFITPNTFYEIVYSSSNLYIYGNGVLIETLGAAISEPSYMELNTWIKSSMTNHYIWIWGDAYSTDGYVVGIGTDESPDTWININSNNEIDVEWTANTIDPYGAWNDTEIFQMRVTWLDAGTVVNTTILDTTKPSGFVVYNRSTLMPVPNYGIYKFDLLKDSVVMETDYLTFLPIGASGTLSWDKIDYVPYQNASITYAVTPYTPADYNYYIRTYEINIGLVDTNTININSGTMTELLDYWDTGSYYSLLVVVDKSDGTEYTVAFDVFDINDEVRFEGYTYDAENGVILNSTHVNFTQGTTWYNSTSNATAYYELDGLTDSTEITLNASNTNFTHEDFTFTPPTAKLYTTNLYLFKTNRSLNSTSIVEGMTVDYPLHQAVGSATVNLYNATWSNTTTSNAFGYYQFNLSELVNGTYTVNATLSGYDNSSEYSITVVKNESTVQNIVLNQAKILTVTVIDSETNNPILNFTASVNGMTTTVGDGDAEFSLDWGLYTVTVTSTGYYSSSENVLMDKNRSVEISLTTIDSVYYIPHYVKFTVQNVWGTKYNGVDVSVYEGSDTDTTFTATTGEHGEDGAVGFKLSETTQYRITFINSTAGISREITIYPIDTHYIIYVDTLDLGIPDTTGDDVSYYWTTERINSTHAYINFTWTDTSSSSTDFTYWINDSDNSPLAVYPDTTTTTNYTNSTIVPANSDRYYVHVIGNHPTWGEIEASEVIFFGGRMIDLGWSEDWHYSTVAFCGIVFVGLLFGAVTAHYGAVIAVMFAWFFRWVGWLDTSSTSTLLLILATVVAFGFVMRKGEVVRV